MENVIPKTISLPDYNTVRGWVSQEIDGINGHRKELLPLKRIKRGVLTSILLEATHVGCRVQRKKDIVIGILLLMPLTRRILLLMYLQVNTGRTVLLYLKTKHTKLDTVVHPQVSLH